MNLIYSGLLFIGCAIAFFLIERFLVMKSAPWIWQLGSAILMTLGVTLLGFIDPQGKPSISRFLAVLPFFVGSAIVSFKAPRTPKTTNSPPSP
jgi:hypothetical protein